MISHKALQTFLQLIANEVRSQDQNYWSNVCTVGKNCAKHFPRTCLNQPWYVSDIFFQTKYKTTHFVTKFQSSLTPPPFVGGGGDVLLYFLCQGSLVPWKMRLRRLNRCGLTVEWCGSSRPGRLTAKGSQNNFFIPKLGGFKYVFFIFTARMCGEMIPFLTKIVHMFQNGLVWKITD